MKKSFPFEVPPHKPPRVVESIKNDVRKYIKRERRKKLPEDVDFWDFDCRTGQDSDTATSVHVEEVTSAIDKASAESWPVIFIEILSKPGHRTRKPRALEQPETDSDIEGEEKADSESPDSESFRESGKDSDS